MESADTYKFLFDYVGRLDSCELLEELFDQAESFVEIIGLKHIAVSVFNADGTRTLVKINDRLRSEGLNNLLKRYKARELDRGETRRMLSGPIAELAFHGKTIVSGPVTIDTDLPDVLFSTIGDLMKSLWAGEIDEAVIDELGVKPLLNYFEIDQTIMTPFTQRSGVSGAILAGGSEDNPITINKLELIQSFGKIFGMAYSRIVRENEHEDFTEQIRSSRETAKALLNAPHQMSVLINTEGVIIDLNETAAKSLGDIRSNLVGKYAYDLFDEQTAETRRKYNEQVVETKASIRYDDNRNGRYFDTVVYPILDLDGRVSQLAIVSNDVTEKIMSEKTLRLSEEKYRGLFDESVAAIYIFDAEKNFIDSNQAGLDLLGYSYEEMMTMSIPDVDADPVVVLPAHQQLLGGDRIVNYEHQLRRKNGDVITVLNNSRPLTDGDGNVVGMLSTLIDITERKKSERALKESQATMQALIENTDDFILFSDKDALPVYFNRNYAEVMKAVLGIEMKPGLQPHKLLDNPEEIAAWDQYHRRVLSGERFAAESAMDLGDGFVRYLEHRFNPIITDGEVVGFSEITRDITAQRKYEQEIQAAHNLLEERVVERTRELEQANEKLVREIEKTKEAEVALKRSVNRFDAIVNNAPEVGIQSYDSEGRVIFWNPASEKVFGYSAKEAAGKTLDQLIMDTDSAAEFLATIRHIRETGESVGPYEWIFIDKSGAEGHLISAMFSIDSPDGDKEYICMDVDISARIKAEEALWMSEQLYRTLVETSPDAIVLCDKSGSIIAANRPAALLFGFADAAEMIARPVTDFISDEFVEAHNAMVKSLASGSAPGASEFDFYGAEQAIFVGEIRVSSLLDPGGEAENYMAIIRDVTERRRAEKTLLRAYEKLKRLDEVKNVFISNITHELRTPLVSIKGYAELLSRRHEPGSDAGDWLSRILSGASRLESTINDVLDISKIESGGMSVNFEVSDIDEFIEQGIKTIQPRLEAKKLSLKTDIQTGLPKISVDRRKFLSVILNLLDNAVKFSDEGAEIEIRAELDSKNNIIATFSDNGCGISSRHIEKIFTRFFQVDSDKNQSGEGSGIGLALVREIIEIHGGKVWAESEPGKGSQFFFTVPPAGGEIDAARASDEESLTAPIPKESKLKILAVDDDPETLGLFKMICAEAGCEIDAMHSPEGVVEKAVAELPDLIILDMGLPGASGAEICRALRAEAVLTDTPVYIISAYTTEIHEQQAKLAGATGYINKPFPISRLFSLIEDVASAKESTD